MNQLLTAATGVMLAVAAAGTAQTGPAWKGRVAASHDGNIHDPDDIGAAAFVFAIVWSHGFAGRFVHQHHSNSHH